MPGFGRLVLFLVFCNCVTMAIQPPCAGSGGCADSTFARALFVLDTVFTVCFTVEILMQAVAHCFVLGPYAYLHDGWNWIDLLSTACGYLVFLPAANGGGINGLRALRAMRPLRALKAIPAWPHPAPGAALGALQPGLPTDDGARLRLLVQCLLELVPLLMDVLFLLVWVFFVFGIIGLNLFMGALHHRCSAVVNATSLDAAYALVAMAAAAAGGGEADGYGGVPPAAPPLAPPPVALNGSEVLPQWLVVVPGLENQPCSESGVSGAYVCDDTWEGYNVTCGGDWGNPNFGYAGFDNFGVATFNIFAVMTLDAWSESQLYPQWYANGPPVPVLFFYALVMFGAFFTMQLLVAIMSSKFAQLADKAVSQPPSRSVTRANLMLEETADLRMSGDGTAPADPNGTVSAFASGASTPGGRPRSALSVACWRGVRSVASALDRLDARWEALCAAVSRGLYNFKLRYMQPVHRVTLPPWRRRCLKVVSSAWFNNGMTALIIVNTAALGMEHYGMSKQWLAVIDLINMVLTYIFIAELVLKHVAMGFIRYWTDAWNILDGFIVAVSIADLIVVATGGSKTGTQAFRTMRVLRVLRSLKLLRRIKGLHRLLRMVLRGFYTLRDFILLLALFVFVFAVLGFQQFGGLWSFTPEANPLWPLKSRSNFNSMWSSAYTVFQILTCDDWVRITWNGMRGGGNASVLFFIAWVIIGNFILLTLFLAILITSFQSDEEEVVDDVEKVEPSFAGVDGPSSGVSIGSNANRSGLRHRGVGGSGAATPRGGGAAAGSAYGGNRRRPANALQLRVRERVSERLDPASVRIMKRWLIMMGVTHGMKEDEVNNIVRECDARLSHDPDYINRDTSFTAPHLLNRRALQQASLSASQASAGAGGGGGGGVPAMKRGSTLRRHTAAIQELVQDLPTMPEDRVPSHALAGLPAAAAAVVAAGELGVAVLVRSDGEGGISSGPEERAARGGRATPKLSRSMTAERQSTGSRPRTAGVSRAGTAERKAGGGSGADGGRTSGGSAARSGLGSAQASAPLPLTERHSGTSGVVGLLERLSHAVRSKVLGGMRSGGVSPRASNPGILAGDRGERGERWHGARVKVDLPPPPPSPYGAATPHGPYGLGARRSTPGADGSRRVSAGGASPHGAQSPGGYLNAAAGGPAGPGPSRMGRAPVPVRQDSWAMLVPSTDALRAAAAAAARQQQIMDDAYVRHRLQAWLHDSQVALRANSLTSAKPSPFAAPAGSHAAAAAGAAAGLADPGSGYGHDAGAGCEDSGPDPVTEQLRFSEGTRQRRLLLRAISRDRHLPGPGQLVAAGSLPRTGSRGAAAGAAAAEAAAAAAAAGQAGVEATSLAGGDSFATGPAIASGGGADAAASANASRALLQRPPLGLGMAGTSAADEANAALTQHLRRSFQRRHSMPSQDPDTLENVRVMLGVGALLNGSPVDGGSGFGISAAGGGGSGKALQPSVTVAGAAGRGYVLAGSSFAMRADGGGAARGGGHPAAADYATEPLLVLKAAVARLESLGLVAGAGRGSGAQRSRAGRGGGHVHSRLGEAPLEDGERILSGGTGHPHNGRTVSGRTDNDRTVSGRTDNDRTLSGRTDNGRTVSGRTGDGMSGGEEPVRYSLESAAGTSSIEGLGRGGAQYSGSGLADGRTSDSTRGDSLDAASAHASGSGAAGAPEPTPRSPRFWSELGGGPAAGRHASGEVETSVSGGGAGAGVGVVADRLLSRSRSGRRRSLLRRHSHSGSDYSPSRGASPSRMGPSRRVTAGTSSSAKPSSSAQLRMPLAPAPASGAVGAMSATEALRDQQFVSDRVPEIQPAYGNGGAGVRQSSAGGIGPGVTDAAAVADAAEHRRQALALHHVFGEQSGNFFRRSRTLPDNPDDAGVMAAVAAAAAAELHLGHGTAPAGRGRSGAGGVDEGDGPRVSGQDAPGPPRPPPLVPPPPLVIPVPAGATPAHRHNPAHAQGHATSVLTGGTRGTPASNVGTAGSRVSGPPSLAPSSASSFGAGQGVLLRGGSSLRRQAAAAAAVTAAHRPHGDEGERAAAYATAAAAAAEAAATPGSGASSHGARTPSTAALHDLAAALNRFHGQQPWAAEATVEEEHPAGAASASGPAGTTLPGVAQPHRGAASVAGEAVTTINPFFEAGPELEPERLTGVEERDFFGGDLFPVALFGNPLARVSAGSSRTSHTSRQLPMLSMLLPAEAAVAAAGGGAEGQGGGSRTASVQSIPPASQLAAAAAVAGQLAALRQAQEGGGSGVVGVDSTGFYSKSPSGRSAATAATDPTPLPSDQLLLMLEAEVAAAALNAASGGVAGNGGRTAAAVAAVLAGGGGPSRDGATINGAAARGHSAGGAGAAAGHEAQQGSGSGMAPASQLSPSALAPSPFAKSLSGRSPETGPPAWEAPAPRGGAAEGAGTGAGAAPTNGHEATAAPPAEKLRAMALMAAAATALAARRGAADSAESPLRARGGKPPVPGLPPTASLSHAGIGAGGAQDGAASSLGIASASASHETGGPLASGTHAGVNTTAELRGPAAAGVPVSGAGPTAAPAAGGGARGWAERVARLPLPHGPATGEGGAAAGGASARSAAVQHLLRGLLVSALRRRTEAAGAEPPAQVQQPQEGPGPAAARRGGAPGPVCESRVDDESDSLPGGGSPAPHLSRTSVPGSVAAPATLDSPGLASGGSPIATPFTRLSGFNTDLTITPPAHSVTAVPGPGAAAMQASAAMGSAPGFGSTAKDRSAGAAAGGGGFAEHAVHSSGGSIYGSGGITGSSSAAAAAAAATGPRRGFLPPRLQVLDGHGGHRQGPGSAHDAPRSPRGGSPLGPLANTGAASAGPLPGGGAPAAYSSYGNSGYGNNSMYGTNNSGYSGYGGLGSGQGTGTTSTPRVSAPGNTGGAGGGGGPGRRGNAPPGAGSRRPPPLRTVSSRRRTDRDHYTSHGSRTLSPGRRTAAVATDTWTPRDVARARAAGGPRDAAEMEAALYAPMQLAVGRDPILSATRQRVPMAPASRQVSRQNTRRRRGSAAQLNANSVGQARGDSSYGVLTSPTAAAAAAHAAGGGIVGGASRSTSFVMVAAAAAARLLSGGRISTPGSSSRRGSTAGTGAPTSPLRRGALGMPGVAAPPLPLSAPQLPDLLALGGGGSAAAIGSASGRGGGGGGGGSAGAPAADSPAATDHSDLDITGAMRSHAEDSSIARRRLVARVSTGPEPSGAKDAAAAASAPPPLPPLPPYLGSSGSPQHEPRLVDPSNPGRGRGHDDDDDELGDGLGGGLTDVEDAAGALLSVRLHPSHHHHQHHHDDGGLDEDDDVALADEERDQMGEYGKHGGGDGVGGGDEEEGYDDAVDGGEYGSDLFDDQEDEAPYLRYSAFFALRPYHPLRIAAAVLINHRWFDNVMLVVILASSATLAIDTPRLDKSSPLGHAVAILDIIFTSIFTLEMCIKLVAKGVVLHPHAYLRNGWDVLDGFIVLTSLLSVGISGAGAGALKAVRLVRALRPLRLVKRWRGMRLVVETLIRSLPTLAEVVAFGAFMFAIFGILGVQLFAGRFSICNQVVINGTLVSSRSECVEGVEFTCSEDDVCDDGPGSTAARWWGPPMRNFDHLGRALLTLFTVVTLDGFMEVAWSCMDAVGYDEVPQLNAAPWMGLYVIAFVFLGSFFWVNVLVSVIIDHYTRLVEEEGDLLVTKQAKEYMKIFKFERVGKDVWKGGCPPDSGWLRRCAWATGSHRWFDQMVLATICINIAAMAAVYDGSSRDYDVALGMVNVACTLIFAVEAAVKITALGWPKYWRDNWNKLDLFIVLVSIPDIVATFTSHNAATGIVTAMRLLRVCRMFKLIRGAKGLRTLFNTLISSLPAIGNVGSLLLLIMYIYAIIGINMYGGYGSPFDNPGSIADYNDIGAAMATQFRLFSADGWGDLMAQGMGCNGNQYQCDTGAAALGAAFFFCSFVLLATFIMLNLVIAVVLDNFIDNAQLEGFLKTSNFVDLLRMVITLRVFVRLMRIKIDLLRKVDRSRALASGPRLASKRLMRSRASTLGGLSVATGGLGGGASSGGLASAPIHSPSVMSMSSRVSGELLPRLAKAVSRLGGGSGRLQSGTLSALLGLGSPDAGGGAGGAAGAAAGAAGAGAHPVSGSQGQVAGAQRRTSNASSMLLSTIQPVLPRRQDSAMLLAAEAIAARAAVAAAAGSNGGGSGTTMAGGGAGVGSASGTTGNTSFAGTLPSGGRRRMTADDALLLAAPGTPRVGGDGSLRGGMAGSAGAQSGANSDGEGARSIASSGGRSHRSGGSGGFLGLRDLREAVLRRRRRKSLLGMHPAYTAAVVSASAAAGASGGTSPHAHRQHRRGAAASGSAAHSPSGGGSAAEPSMSNAESGGTHTDGAVSSAGGAGPSSGDRSSHGRGRGGRSRGGGHSRRALPYSGLILATTPGNASGAASVHSGGGGGGGGGSASSLTLLPAPRMGGDGSSRPGSPLMLTTGPGRRRSLAGAAEGYGMGSPLARAHGAGSGGFPAAGERTSSPSLTPRSSLPPQAVRPYGTGSADGAAPASASSPAAATTPTRASASGSQVDAVLPAAAFGSVFPPGGGGESAGGVSGGGGSASGAVGGTGNQRGASGNGGGGGSNRGAAGRHLAALLSGSGAHGAGGASTGSAGGGSHQLPSRLSSMSGAGAAFSYAGAATTGSTAPEAGAERDGEQRGRSQHASSPLPPRSPAPATPR
eukprot:XP_001692912.1 voltage-gated Ca2+ channel, alpha subunit [Chlamydomonas reinhardtii]